MKKLFLIILLIPALAYSFTYRNNAQTGKPDLVTTSVSDLSDIGVGYVSSTTFNNYTSIDRLTPTSSPSSFPTLNQNTTGSAAKLTTGRTIAITGPITYTSPSFDGSGNVTAAATITSQTGTGSTFVMSVSPSITDLLTVTSTAESNIFLNGADANNSLLKWLKAGTSVMTLYRPANTNDLQIYDYLGGGGDMVKFGSGGRTMFGTTTDNTVDRVQVSGSLIATTLKQSSGGSSGKVICWKTATTLGYCSTVVDAAGACTCN